MLSRNVGEELPLLAAQNYRRVQFLSPSRPKHEITQNIKEFKILLILDAQTGLNAEGVNFDPR